MVEITRFVLLSGPSCVGKGPLIKAVKVFHPEVKFRELGVLKSLESRPNGQLRSTDDPRDFLKAAELLKLQGDPRYIVGDCRGLPQAVDLERLTQALAQTDAVFLEAYFTLGKQVAGNVSLTSIPGLATTSVFLSPLNDQELAACRPEDITKLMMRKHLARAKALGTGLTDKWVMDALDRAADSNAEIATKQSFTRVLVNHDGEGHTNWNIDQGGKIFTARPTGDAGKTLAAFVRIF